MANNRYNFSSLGASAVDELTRVLSERRALQQQEFLNKIRQQEQDRIGEIQRAQLESINAQRQSVIDQNQREDSIAYANLMRPGQEIDETTEQKLGPLAPFLVSKRQDALHENLGSGEVDVMNPDGTFGTQGAPAVIDRRTFTGTPTQLETQRKQDHLKSLLNDPNLSADDRLAIQYQLGTGQNAPAGMFDRSRQVATGSFEDYVVRKFGQSPTADQVMSARKEWEAANDSQNGSGGGNPYFIPQTLYDGQGRPVGVARFDARTGELENITPPTADTTIKPPPAALGNQTIINEASLSALDNLKGMYDGGARELIGPAAGRMRSLGQQIPGIETDQKFNNFKAATDAFKNEVIKAITGAAMSEAEATRIIGQIPTENDKPEVWMAKYEQTKLNLQRLEQALRNKGSQGPSSAQTRTIRNPKTGETRQQTSTDGGRTWK